MDCIVALDYGSICLSGAQSSQPVPSNVWLWTGSRESPKRVVERNGTYLRFADMDWRL